MVWKKGQSGNPGGKPKEFAIVRKQLRDAVPGALQRLVDLVGSDDERVALLACKEILNRTLGVPKPVDEESAAPNEILARLLGVMRPPARTVDAEIIADKDSDE